MKATTYKALLTDLQKLQKTLVTSQIAMARRDPVLGARLARLHAEAEVGGRLDDFVATTVRKSTVLFLLRVVFVRVLEDLDILRPRRIRDDWGFTAFREVAPALSRRSYFAFVFRDLAVDFPALFAPGADEVPLPDEDGCRALWDLWHHPNRDGEQYVWNGDGFDSRFLGDLYQDLDKDIRKRFALLQTPHFVESYILDHTLTPALAEFDPATLRAKGQTFRVIDPTCGSGHFLTGTFHRLADYWRDRHGLSEWAACERALESVWGCDINPHAIDIAEFRLLLEVVARTGVKDLDRLSWLKLNLRSMDSLIPWERAAKQGELFAAKDRLDAYATPGERRENAAFLARDFHVVVGNPPYITPKDVRKRDDYRVFWPDSAAGKYALSAPFAERLFVLGLPGSFVGQITSNSFMKREFGKRLIGAVFPRFDLTGVLDTSGAYIPGHGTPTVILLGRSRPPEAPMVRAILGKRGEPGRPLNPADGLVWSGIRSAGIDPDDTNAFVTVANLSRADLSSHPWSLGGGQAREIQSSICGSAHGLLSRWIADIGPGGITGQDDLFIRPDGRLLRSAIARQRLVEVHVGDELRDYAVARNNVAIVFSYQGAPPRAVASEDVRRLQWPWRPWIRDRPVKGFGKISETTEPENRLSFFYPSRFASARLLVFPFVSTHNHFVLDGGGKVFKQTSPVVKLTQGATLDDHLDLLGLLNSSALGFWMKQVFHNKGASSGEAIRSEDWEPFWEYDSTKLQQAPITDRDRDARVELARALDATAEERATCLPAAVLAAGAWNPASLAVDLVAGHLRYLELTRRMVALQEELDWLTYSSYGLIEPVVTVDPDASEPLAPGHRPFEIVLARADDEADDDEKSAWWSRHGHDRVTEIPEFYSEAHRARIQQRIELIESDTRIALLETPPYKRRWQLPDWTAETKKAAEAWLLDRLEDLFAPASETTPRGPLADPTPYRLEEIIVALERDPRVAAVAGVWAGTGHSVDVSLVVEKLLRSNALPDHPHRVYSDEGLRKLDEWKRVWALQDQEDAWDKVAAEATARGEVAPAKVLTDPADPTKVIDTIPLPPKFDKHDFVRAEFFSIRGKLNVPRERFILFADLTPNRYGWNGWRNGERALAQVHAFTLAESDPQEPLPRPTVEAPRRCGVTFGLWESLADVRRWSTFEEHAEFRSLAVEACRQQTCPCPVVDAWKPLVLHGKPTGPTSPLPIGTTTPKGKRKVVVPEPDDLPPAEAQVTLGERAWIASLFEPGKELEAAGVWSRHRARLAEPPQRSIPGLGPPVQLTMPAVIERQRSEVTTLDEGRLARVLDDLIASGDVEVRGRGKKKRYKVVPRGLRVEEKP